MGMAPRAGVEKIPEGGQGLSGNKMSRCGQGPEKTRGRQDPGYPRAGQMSKYGCSPRIKIHFQGVDDDPKRWKEFQKVERVPRVGVSRR